MRYGRYVRPHFRSGHRRALESGDERPTITVLDETHVVDGSMLS
jgi:hypothetical protein